VSHSISNRNINLTDQFIAEAIEAKNQHILEMEDAIEAGKYLTFSVAPENVRLFGDNSRKQSK
jgi:hypothetical protein